MTELLPAVTALLTQRLGLAPASIGDRIVESILRRRMSETASATSDDYLKRLRTDPQELKALIEAIVVPESWFFRYPESFAMLVEAAKQRKQNPSIAVPYRVLCSPCSTGEEAYSAAVALVSAGFDANAIEVIGTDISADAVTKARAGIYSPSSFREAEPKIFTALLNAVSVLTDGKRAVSDEIKKCVQFFELNLVDESERMPPGPFDAVFCRNLLIYLTEAARVKVLKRLELVLAPTGCLFLGHAEGNALAGLPMEAIGRAQAFAFRRRTQTRDISPPPIVVKPRPTPPFITPVKPLPPHELTPYPDEAKPTPILMDIESVERNINAGSARPMVAELEMAAAVSPSAKIYTLLGTAYSMLGNDVESERAFSQALYLDPNCYDALVQLRTSAERRGDTAAAENFRRRAAKAERRPIQ